MVVAQELDGQRNETPKPVELSQKLIKVLQFLDTELICQEIGERVNWSTKTVWTRISFLYSEFGIKRISGENYQKRRLRLLETADQRGYRLKEKPLLTPKQIETLKLMGLGRTNGQIAENLGISYQNVEYRKIRIFKSLGAQDNTQAVLRAISLGILNLDRLTSNYDLSRYSLLSSREKEILSDLANLENIPGNKVIGWRLGISEQKVKNNVSHILKKLRLENRTQAAVFYLAANSPGKTSRGFRGRPPE